MRMRPSFVRVDDSNTRRRDNKARRDACPVTALTLWLIGGRDGKRASGLWAKIVTARAWGAASRAASRVTSVRAGFDREATSRLAPDLLRSAPNSPEMRMEGAPDPGGSP